MRTGEECALKSGPKPGVEGGISAVPVFEMIIDASPDTNNGVFRRYHVGNNPVNFIDPLGLAEIEIEFTKGSYRFVKYLGDDWHGEYHWHVYDRRTGNLLGKVGVSGTILNGRPPRKAMKMLRKAGWIGAGVTAICVYDAMTADETEALEDVLETLESIPPDRRDRMFEAIFMNNPGVINGMPCH